MKCENLLLDSLNNVKVSDFGFCREFQSGDICKTFCGSAAYAAPEILQGIPYHAPVHDMWSLGVILYIMVGTKKKKTEIKKLHRIILSVHKYIANCNKTRLYKSNFQIFVFSTTNLIQTLQHDYPQLCTIINLKKKNTELKR